MLLSVNRITRLNIGWNERPFDEREVQQLCLRFKIKVDERPLATNGFYYRLAGQDMIVVNSRLSRIKRLEVLLHELAHFLLHAPASGPAAGFHHIGGRTRQEREADAFAHCALIPKNLIECRSHDELLADGFPPEMVAERYELFARYGI